LGPEYEGAGPAGPAFGQVSVSATPATTGAKRSHDSDDDEDEDEETKRQRLEPEGSEYEEEEVEGMAG